MNKVITDYLTPPTRERLPETIADQIKHLILSKKLLKGEKLPSERELTTQLRVSRVVIRQALMSLEQSGLIKIKRGPAGGAFILDQAHKPFSDYIRDLISEGNLTFEHFVQARKAIEVFNIELASKKATPDDIQILRSINARIIEKLKRSSDKDWKMEGFHIGLYKTNKEFHIAIAEISGNPLMEGITRSLFENIFIFLKEKRREMFSSDLKEFTTNLYKRHEKIIDNIEKRDTKKCIVLIKKDISYKSPLDS